MPRLQDIELFKRDLAALSHEAEVLERWGEKPEAITPPEGAAAAPEAGAPSPAPAHQAGAPKAEAPGEAPSGADEEAAPPDFAALLDGLPLGDESSPAPGGAESGGSLDDELAALLGDQGTAGAETGSAAESPAAEPPGFEAQAPFEIPPEAPESPAAEPSPTTGADDFSIPDFDVGEPEPEARGEAQEPATPTEGPEAFDFSIPEPDGASPSKPNEPAGVPEPADGGAVREEDFSIPDFDLAEEPAQPGASPEGASEGREKPPEEAQPAEESFGADFSIPDFDSETAGTPSGDRSRGPAENSESGKAEEPATGADGFESFTFEEPGASAAPGSSLGDFGAEAPSQDLDTEIASLSEEAPVADTFKLDQGWGGFDGFGGEAPAKEAPPRPSPQRASSKAKADEEAKSVKLTEAQVDRLQDALLSYPLNLRVAVEDIIANAKGSDAQQSKLVWLLVDGASAEEAAALAGRILKRHVPVPKGSGKRTGAALEAQKGTLAYAFVHTFIPVIKIGLLVFAAFLAVIYLGWRFVVVPLSADSLYRQGYQRIAEDRYPEAETDFAKATAMREYISWYYRYAAAYAAKRQYILAEKKYSSLVAAHPKEVKGILAWARLEKDQLKYEEAVEVLKGAPRSKKADAARGMTGLLSWDYFNKEGLLLLGDVYLDWGEESPDKYEEARRTYAMLLERYGGEEAYLERMLLYFIRVDKLDEVLPLKDHFLADPKGSALSAQVLAELGGYLLDKGRLEDVRGILLEAAKKDPSVPEAHYHLARYFIRAGDPKEERLALDKAAKAFADLPARKAKQTGMYIDSLIWRGRFYAEAKEWVAAEKDFAAAAEEYENALELRRVVKSGRFGEAYAGLGDVAYRQSSDLAAALAYYDRAEADGYSTPDTCYRRGNILYGAGRYAEALAQFYAAQAKGGSSPNLDYAFASALRARNDLFASEAYYRRVSAAMAKLLQNAGAPTPQENPSQIDILRLYLKAENNLGVALYRSAARSGDARRRNEAMASFAHSARLYDQLSQEPAALGASPESRNLALANMNALLASGRGEDLISYSTIEKDLRFPGGEQGE